MLVHQVMSLGKKMPNKGKLCASRVTVGPWAAILAGACCRDYASTPHVARQALYDRTWVTIAAQLLHGQDPPASDQQVASEHLAFQRAICKVEVEMAIQGNAPEKEQREQVQRRRPF